MYMVSTFKNDFTLIALEQWFSLDSLRQRNCGYVWVLFVILLSWYLVFYMWQQHPIHMKIHSETTILPFANHKMVQCVCCTHLKRDIIMAHNGTYHHWIDGFIFCFLIFLIFFTWFLTGINFWHSNLTIAPNISHTNLFTF